MTAGCRALRGGPWLFSLKGKAQSMIGSNKLWLRLAIAIHERLRMAHQARAELKWPANWHQCEILFRRLQRAESQGWLLAAQRVRRELQAMLSRLQVELSDFTRSLERASRISLDCLSARYPCRPACSGPGVRRGVLRSPGTNAFRDDRSDRVGRSLSRSFRDSLGAIPLAERCPRSLSRDCPGSQSRRGQRERDAPARPRRVAL